MFNQVSACREWTEIEISKYEGLTIPFSPKRKEKISDFTNEFGIRKENWHLK